MAGGNIRRKLMVYDTAPASFISERNMNILLKKWVGIVFFSCYFQEKGGILKKSPGGTQDWWPVCCPGG